MVHWWGLNFCLPVGLQQQAGRMQSNLTKAAQKLCIPFPWSPATYPREVNWQCGFLGSEEGSRAEGCF